MATRLITVSQLKCACLEWRRRWPSGEKPPTHRPFDMEGVRVPVQGVLFHQIAEEFTEWMSEGQMRKTAAGLASSGAIWDQCYERFAKRKLNELLAAGKLPSAHHLSRALRAFCEQ